MRNADRRENLDALAVVRRVGDDERAVRLDGERGRIDDAARLGADVHDLPRARSSVRRGRNTMCARRSKTKYWPDADCWKPTGSRKRPGDVRRDGRDRADQRRANRRERDGGEHSAATQRAGCA